MDVVGTGLHRTDIPLNPLTAKQRGKPAWRCCGRRESWRLARRRFLTLSYGERRLVLLARVLAWRAAVLILDEVATALMPATASVSIVCCGSRRLRGTTWICSAHRDEDIPPGATHLLWLEAGRVRHAGRISRSRLREALAAARTQDIRQPAARPRARPSGRIAARPYITLRNATVWIDEKRVLQGLDLTVSVVTAGWCMAPNGSGKSTLVAYHLW